MNKAKEREVSYYTMYIYIYEIYTKYIYVYIDVLKNKL